MDDWLLQERQRLLRLGVRAFIKAAAVTVAIMLLLITGLWLVVGGLGLGEDTLSRLLMVIVVAVPVVAFILADWIRRWFWVRAISGHVRRLRAVRFLSHYVDAVGEDRISELPQWAQQRVRAALKREREGVLPPEKEYALAIQPLLLLEPENTAHKAAGQTIGRGPRASHRHRQGNPRDTSRS